MSEVTIFNTAGPQGISLSPLMFLVYTNEFTIQDSDFRLCKYTGDSGLLSNGDLTGENLYELMSAKCS